MNDTFGTLVPHILPKLVLLKSLHNFVCMQVIVMALLLRTECKLSLGLNGVISSKSYTSLVAVGSMLFQR